MQTQKVIVWSPVNNIATYQEHNDISTERRHRERKYFDFLILLRFCCQVVYVATASQVDSTVVPVPCHPTKFHSVLIHFLNLFGHFHLNWPIKMQKLTNRPRPPPSVRPDPPNQLFRTCEPTVFWSAAYTLCNAMKPVVSKIRSKRSNWALLDPVTR